MGRGAKDGDAARSETRNPALQASLKDEDFGLGEAAGACALATHFNFASIAQPHLSIAQQLLARLQHHTSMFQLPALRLAGATRVGSLQRFPRPSRVRFLSTAPTYDNILLSNPAPGVTLITLNRPKALNGPSASHSPC